MHYRCFDKRIALYASEMTDYRSAGSLGARIQAARKSRGMSARELAEAIGGLPTQATIENIETGRKVSVDVVQLLNIAMAVRVPLSYLLAPMGRPDSTLDLPGLSGDFDTMTSAELDAWIASVPDGAHFASSLEERNAAQELQALREWGSKRAEISRLQAALAIERSAMPEPGPFLRSTEARLAQTQREGERLAAFLRSAGWSIDS